MQTSPAEEEKTSAAASDPNTAQPGISLGSSQYLLVGGNSAYGQDASAVFCLIDNRLNIVRTYHHINSITPPGYELEKQNYSVGSYNTIDITKPVTMSAPDEAKTGFLEGLYNIEEDRWILDPLYGSLNQVLMPDGQNYITALNNISKEDPAYNAKDDPQGNGFYEQSSFLKYRGDQTDAADFISGSVSACGKNTWFYYKDDSVIRVCDGQDSTVKEIMLPEGIGDFTMTGIRDDLMLVEYSGKDGTSNQILYQNDGEDAAEIREAAQDLRKIEGKKAGRINAEDSGKFSLIASDDLVYNFKTEKVLFDQRNKENKLSIFMIAGKNEDYFVLDDFSGTDNGASHRSPCMIYNSAGEKLYPEEVHQGMVDSYQGGHLYYHTDPVQKNKMIIEDLSKDTGDTVYLPENLNFDDVTLRKIADDWYVVTESFKKEKDNMDILYYEDTEIAQGSSLNVTMIDDGNYVCVTDYSAEDAVPYLYDKQGTRMWKGKPGDSLLSCGPDYVYLKRGSYYAVTDLKGNYLWKILSPAEYSND